MFTFRLSSDELFKANFSFRDETCMSDRIPRLESKIKIKFILYVDSHLAFLMEMRLDEDYSGCILSALSSFYTPE